MSIQRAVVNCRRCYALAQSLKDANNVVNGTHELSVVQSNSLYVARNEAMRALEEVIGGKAMNVKAEKFPKDARVMFGGVLNACMDCGYNTPQISDMTKAYTK